MTSKIFVGIWQVSRHASCCRRLVATDPPSIAGLVEVVGCWERLQVTPPTTVGAWPSYSPLVAECHRTHATVDEECVKKHRTTTPVDYEPVRKHARVGVLLAAAECLHPGEGVGGGDTVAGTGDGSDSHGSPTSSIGQ